MWRMMSRGIIVAVGADPIAQFHRVRDQGLDLDDVAALGRGWDVDQGARPSVHVLDAGGDRYDHIGLAGPERTVAHLGDADDTLRIGELDAGRDARLAGAQARA